MGQDRAYRIVCASHVDMVGLLAYRYCIFPHTWRAPRGSSHSPNLDSLAGNFHLDFPSGDTLVSVLDCYQLCAEGEEKSLIQIKI